MYIIYESMNPRGEKRPRTQKTTEKGDFRVCLVVIAFVSNPLMSSTVSSGQMIRHYSRHCFLMYYFTIVIIVLRIQGG